MNRSNQYIEDCEKLAGLVERYTGIPKDRTYRFVMDNSASELLPSANLLCNTDTQKNKLAALFEFKNLYETIKGAENSREYTLDTTVKAMDYFTNYFADMNDKERFTVALLDSGNRIIATKIISTGTVNEAPVQPREIIKEALFRNAVSVVLAHNHPSGTTRPSNEDIATTHRIKQFMEIVNIRLLDHIIVVRDEAISLADMGLIDTVNSRAETSKAASPISEKPEEYALNKAPFSVKQQLAAAKERRVNEQAALRPVHDKNRKSGSRYSTHR